MVDTKVDLCGLVLDNPVIPASGTFGFGKEFAELYDLNTLGSIAIKGTTEKSRYGNELPRIAECDSGLINSIGLQNPGVNTVVTNELPDLAKVYDKKIIANIGGFSVEEYENVASALDFSDQVGIIEVNISCPNVHEGGKTFGQDAEMAARVTKAVKNTVNTPVFVKLSPNVTDIVEIAEACVDAGADGLSLVNTFLGARIDIKSREFVIANKMGGFSGPAIFPVALRMVYEVSNAVDVPIMGIGGIDSAEKVIEMMMAGATAVQVGAANLTDPFVCKKIIEDLPGVMQKLNIKKLEDIIGVVE